MKTRVLQIIPTLDRGGAEKQLALLAAGLPRDRFDVHVCALTRGGPRAADLQAAGIPVTVIGKRWKIDPLAYGRLRAFVKSWSPHIVHTWLFAANCYGRQAALAAGVPRIVAAERCVDPWKVGYEFWLDRYYARRTDRLVTNSCGVRDFYARQGLPAEKFAVIPNGIEVASARPSPADRQALLAELGLPSDAILLGSVGRLWPQKRHKDAMWALELVTQVSARVQLLIVGDGPQRWRLEKFAHQIERADRIHFLGERSDAARLIAHFDCFILASGYEGQSNALMEAMAAGVPVVASDIPGNRELVLPNETGFLVPLGDRAGLARRVRQLLDEPQLAQRFAAAAQARMRQEFSVARMIERYAALYESLG